MINQKKYFNYNYQTFQIIKKIEKIAKQSNVSIYYVGGIVRDALRKIYNYDIDIFIIPWSESFIKSLEKSFNTKFNLFSTFETATCKINNHISLDISSLRKDFYSSSGELPLISRGNFSENIFRRDFSINSIVFFKNNFIDLAYGRKDFKNFKCRILYSTSFYDDPTRILRALKFCLRYNLNIEKNTFLCLKKALENNYLLNISNTRFFKELNFIFKEKNFINLFLKKQYLNIYPFILGYININKLKDFILFTSKNYELLENLKIDSFFIFIYSLKYFKISDTDQSEEIYFKFFFDYEKKNPICESKISSSNYILKKLNKKNFDYNSKLYYSLNFLNNYEIFLLIFLNKNNLKIQNHIKKFFYIRNFTPIITGKNLLEIGIVPNKNFKFYLIKAFEIQLNNPKISKEILLKYIIEWRF